MPRPSRLVATLCLVALLLALAAPLAWDASWGALLPGGVAAAQSLHLAGPLVPLGVAAPRVPPLQRPWSRGPPPSAHA